jgi:hypothetical protein
MNIQNHIQKSLPLAILIVLVIGVLTLIKIPLKTQNSPSPSATISWNANTEKDLAGYKIYYGNASRTADCPPGGYPSVIDVGKTETPDKPVYKLGNLEPSKTYYFSVVSYDISGNESCFSKETSKTIPE